MVDDPPRPSDGTVASRQPDEKSLDKREMPPSDSELADRRPQVRSTAAHSATSTSQQPAKLPAGADEYYNPASESAGGGQPTSPSSGNRHPGDSGS
jgi:hypothetical protein